MKNYIPFKIMKCSGSITMARQAKRAMFAMTISLFLIVMSSSYVEAQSVLHSVGSTTICQGTSTTIAVNVDGGDGIYTVVYNDGTTNFTINNYKSNDTNGDDPITVNPTTTKIYSLVSVSFGGGNFLPVDTDTKVTITVNPLPSGINVTVNPAAPVCPGVNYTISATATNGSTYELWNQANTVKIGNMPYVTSIIANTTYTIRAISGTTPACTTTQSYTVNIETTKPVITCPSNQVINPGAGTCSAALPDYRSLVTATDNCTPTGSITLVQSPASGTVLSGHNTNQLVTVTATDAAGNSNSCSFTTTVIDNINPGITCIGNQTVPAGSNCTYIHSGTAWNAVGTDNCTVASVVYNLSGTTTGTGTNLNGVIFQPGTTTVSWTVTDGAGRTNQCSFNVSVEDTQNPTASCSGDQTANTSVGQCTYTHSGTGWNVTAADNCTVASISYALSGATSGTVSSTLNGVVFNKGVTNVVCTVSDGAPIPNTATCNFTVTVTDNQNPTITYPSNIAVNNDADACSASVAVPNVTFGDNCTGSSITWATTGATTLSGNGQVGTQTFNVGITTITYTVTDATGLTAQCSFTVTVTDNQNPTIACPEPISVNNAPGLCNASVEIPAITSSDNCSGSAIAWATTGATELSGSGQMGTKTFNLGITTVSYTVTDGAARTAQCSFTVTVTDNQVPTISCPSNITVSNSTNACNASVAVPAITFGDNCSGSTLAWTMTGATTASGSGQLDTRTFNVGTTTINCTVSDGATPANTASCSFTVTVNDTQKPVINGCLGNIVRTSSPGLCTSVVSWTEPTASDNCTALGSLIWTKSHAPGSVFPSGITTVTYTATDAAGNVSDVCTFNVTVTDNQKPVISNCPTNISTGADAGSCSAVVTWTEPTATDNCTTSGNLVWTKSHTPGSSFNAGSTTVTYTAKDESNNVSIACSFTVTVSDNIQPTSVCKAATIYLNALGVATLTVIDVNNNSSDNCTSAANLIITLSKTSFNCSNKGDNTVVMTVKDASGNQSNCNATVTVADNTAPTITATSGTVNSNVNATTGQCYYTINGSEFDPIVADNCTGSVLSYSVSGATTISQTTGSLAGKQLLKGVNTITWTAVDASGNAVSEPMIFTKTVVDNQAPVISAKTNQNRMTNTGCGYTAAGGEFDVTITDNCSVSTQTYSINGGTAVSAITLNGIVFATGTSSVVWTASDGTNTSTRTFQVTVADDDFPTISQIDNITANINSGCGANVSWTEPTASDNCLPLASFSRIIGPASGSFFTTGNHQIKYRAIDATGNTTYMTFTITVADGTPPTITCPEISAGNPSTVLNPFVRNADNGFCFHTVSGTEFDVVATDGCASNLVVTNSFDGTSTLAGKQIPAGNQTIVWTASDGTNTSTCTIYLKINDTQLPTFNQPTGEPALSYEYNRNTDPGKCYFTIPGTEFDLSNIEDNCTTLTPTFTVTKNGTTFLTGSNSLSGKQFPKDATYPYIIVWTLSDANGNTVVAHQFSISVTDNQAPLYICYGNESRTIAAGACKYVISGTEFDPRSITENCDDLADLTISYTLDGVSGETSKTLAGKELLGGLHPVVWSITDKSGNTTTCSFNIRVGDPVKPVLSSIANQVRNATAGNCYYQASGSEFDPSVTDNCPTVNLVNNQNGGSSLSGFQFPVGITVVVWTATDASNNVVTMQYDVEVKDVTPPTYTLPATVSKNTASNSCYYTVSGTEFDPQGVSDNCTSENYTILNNYNNYRSLEYVQFPVGTTNVIWSVKDNYGNEQLKTIAVTVTDNVKPQITCPASTYTRVADQGQTYYTVGTNEFKPVATDNCSLTSYTNSLNSNSSLNGYHLDPGTHSITWTAVDAAGNSETCTVTVIVLADLFPSITCVGDQSKNTNSGACSYTAVGNEFNATSTSGAATLSFITSPVLAVKPNAPGSLAGAVFPYGTTLVTWTASQTIDGKLYSNNCSFYVFVGDVELPVITPQANINTTTNSGCYASVSIGTPTRSDNCGVYDYWNNAPSSYPIGTTNVTWWIRDIHGNYNSAVQTVTVTDDDAPSISCPGSLCRQVDNLQTFYTVYGHEFNPYS